MVNQFDSVILKCRAYVYMSATSIFLMKLFGKIWSSFKVCLCIFPFVHNSFLNARHSAHESKCSGLFLFVFIGFPGIGGWAGFLTFKVTGKPLILQAD